MGKKSMREYSVEIRGKPLGAKVKCGGVIEDFTSISNAVNLKQIFPHSTARTSYTVSSPLITMQ
jgi:hypothetical protein